MMKFSKILAHRFHSMILAGMRFPLTVLFLAALAVSNIVSVRGGLDCSREIYTFAFGALLCAAAQMLYERIAGPQWRRLALLAAGAVLTGVYYLVVCMLPSIGTEASIRTASWLFAAVIAFIWLPSAFGVERFTDCFTTFFKAFFVSAFYSGVLFGGVSLILAAVDTLLFGIDTRCYGYTAVVIFWFLAPVLLLSMIPRFNSPEDTVAAMKGAQVPKFLETLLSYVLIPIAAVYTLVLLIYIVKSLGDILQNNLLDPLIISYSAAVLVLYLLACGVKNRFASVFRLVMPKVLAVIVLFELVCAFLNMLIGGVTLPRYFILLYGVYAVAAALVLSFASPRRTGAVAAMAIAFALFSTVPPVDAFTVSRVSQTAVLQSTLELNGMLKDGKLQSNATPSAADKQKISIAVNYLVEMGYYKNIAWLKDASKASLAYLGYENDESYNIVKGKVITYTVDTAAPISVEGYQYFYSGLGLYPRASGSTQLKTVTAGSASYALWLDGSPSGDILRLADNQGKTLISVPVGGLYTKIRGSGPAGSSVLPAEKLTFTTGAAKADLTVVFTSLSYQDDVITQCTADVLIRIKQ